MRMVDLIQKKRDGLELTKSEIDFIIEGYTQGAIPDYQVSAWAMSVFFQGMNPREIADLTMAMVKSGDEVDLSAIEGIKVDKHSTGGVGDTTTLVLGPLVAAAGVPVAKMSGRGLGHTGGTIDKLEAIDGFHTEITKEEFIKIVNEIKVAVVGQSGNLTPADKKLYGLRDVTATVNSIPLIASSIMSKKIASGADAIVLDVKTGDGAFMKTLEGSKELARTMVEIGKRVGRNTVAVISDMNQPLGFAVGNALEVKEAIDTLRGHGPEDLTELCLVLGAHMVVLAKKEDDFDMAYNRLKKILASGEAISKLKEFIQAQGGNPEVVDHPERLPQSKYQVEVKTASTGYVKSIKAEEIGHIAMMLGAGRKTKEDSIDLAVGVELKKKVGDPVQEGDVLAVLHANTEDEMEEWVTKTTHAYAIQQEQVSALPLIYDVIE
ncbi:pyrimidine-nucleoside phosphorylase [Ammoniphilus sp. CFH 90114]|uniref:pyrimidine-nucleoside phosphorylase n=1 Tax=Ammoniphilus sp. CFH 90114 TaxID=2493665 RepID=UPI00100E818A|nr:pyrimidine-nucleoside phosphorylase [Ammoniphilus sp. CFH 90114]RXT14018.1 pyrimidine-nucleoside phosphorylase [Ammoniphilus sp. CFH 90114]